MSVHLDMEGSSGELTAKGWRFERICLVDGVLGTPALKLLKATQTSGIPKIGSQYPGVAKCKLKSIIPIGLGKAQVRLRLMYDYDASANVQMADVEVGASLTSAQINTTYTGEPLTVKYKDAAKVTHEQGGEISAFLPNVTISFQQTEFTSPGAKAKKYVGKINAGGWLLDKSAKEAEWLCTGILGRSNDSGKTFQVVYSFQYREWDASPSSTKDGWHARIVYTDPETGRPPADAEFVSIKTFNLKGVEIYQIYETANFDDMFPHK